MSDQLSDIQRDIGEIKATLAGQAASLDEHMRRTDLAEQQVEQLKTFVTEVRTHIRGVKWAGGLVAAGLTLAKTLGLF